MQEAYLRFHREAEVGAPKAFLTTVVTRLAIDHLRSARVRREAYVGPWLPEPLVRDTRRGGARTTRRCRSRSSRCSSGSRRSSAPSTSCTSCSATRTTRSPRSSASGPRTAARSSPARAATSTPGARASSPRASAARRCSRRFLAAVRAGDVEALAGLLAADAVHYADGGGKARATLLPIYGAEKIARLWAALGAQAGEFALRDRRRQRPARRGRLRSTRRAGLGASRSTARTAAIDGDPRGGEPGQARPGRHRARARLAERHVRLGAVHPALAACTSPAAVQRGRPGAGSCAARAGPSSSGAGPPAAGRGARASSPCGSG